MNSQGKRKLKSQTHGNRDVFMRFRASDEERIILQERCEARGYTMAYGIRLALIQAGLLPTTTPLQPKSVVREQERRQDPYYGAAKFHGGPRALE